MKESVLSLKERKTLIFGFCTFKLPASTEHLVWLMH